MDALTIGGLAKKAGVHIETIRYYQRRGLVGEPARPGGGVRRYGTEAVTRITFIRRAQDIGFSLDEIRELLMLERKPGCRDARLIASRKLALVDARMADLKRMRRALATLIAECDSGRRRCCPIIESLAARRELPFTPRKKVSGAATS